MSKIYLITIIVLIFLCTFLNAQSNKYCEGKLGAALAKAKSIGEALFITQKRSMMRHCSRDGPMLTNDSIIEVEKKIIKDAEESNADSDPIIIPRNGGCEPRVLCEKVPLNGDMNGVLAFPQCVEVHRCGGCCQEGYFQCTPVKGEYLTFSPILLFSLENISQYKANHSFTLLNHTECECKCSKTEAQCRGQGKTLDSTICECIKLTCEPSCYSSSTCSFVHGSDTPRCTCRRQIRGQPGTYCRNPNERPNQMCSRCEPANG